MVRIDRTQKIPEAKKLTLPEFPLKSYTLPKEDEKWVDAFWWYNTYVSRPIVGIKFVTLGCRPCYEKVYKALKEAQDTP